MTEQGRVNKTAMTGHTIMGILLALVNFFGNFQNFQECSLCGGAYCAGTLDRWWQNGFAIGKIRRQKAIKHLLGIGFAVYYTVALIGAGNQLVFVYVIPMFILISVFSDSKYALNLN